MHRSASSDKFLLKRASESLINLLRREDSGTLNPDSDGAFYSKYEPQEVLGR